MGVYSYRERHDVTLIGFGSDADLAAFDASALTPGSVATVLSDGSRWMWFPTGTTVPAGAATVAVVGGVWALSGSGGASFASAHTVIGGVTYTIARSDSIIEFDESNGMQPVAMLPADAIHGLFVGRTITFVWTAWDAGLSALPKIDGNGNNVVAFSGMPASATFTPTTTMSTTGSAYTLKWDGAHWVPQ